jgi:hypothetical protein
MELNKLRDQNNHKGVQRERLDQRQSEDEREADRGRGSGVPGHGFGGARSGEAIAIPIAAPTGFQLVVPPLPPCASTGLAARRITAQTTNRILTVVRMVVFLPFY